MCQFLYLVLWKKNVVSCLMSGVQSIAYIFSPKITTSLLPQFTFLSNHASFILEGISCFWCSWSFHYATIKCLYCADTQITVICSYSYRSGVKSWLLLIVILFFEFEQTTALKNGSFRHDIHYWLGKDTSQVCIHILSSFHLLAM